VPTWVECDAATPFVLNESNTIVAHIAEVGQTDGFYPRDSRTKSLAWQWQEYGETTLQPALSPVWWGVKFGSGCEHIRRHRRVASKRRCCFGHDPPVDSRAHADPLGPGSALVPLDEAKLELAVQRAVRAWSAVDDHLADGRLFMLGDTLTFGDVTCGVHVKCVAAPRAQTAGYGRASRAADRRIVLASARVSRVPQPPLPDGRGRTGRPV
jgi:glutathione S-transferase